MLHPFTSSILQAIFANIGRMETIGERIERLRKEAKIPAGALAKAAGVSLSAIQQLEKNESKNPRPETLLGIARKLGKTMEEIVDPGGCARTRRPAHYNLCHRNAGSQMVRCPVGQGQTQSDCAASDVDGHSARRLRGKIPAVATCI